MIFFFEIPILFFLFIFCGILGLELGPILIFVGLIGFFIGLFFVGFGDPDNRLLLGCVFLLPNILLIIIGLCMGDTTIFEAATDFLF